jgi:hypothetical protein
MGEDLEDRTGWSIGEAANDWRGWSIGSMRRIGVH